jgi:hypothetical protein
MQGPELQQLRQRVIASYHLGPMDRAETQAYVEHRLHHVGWNIDPRFEDGAFDAIYTFSAGIPRRINTLCNRSLLAAMLSEEHLVTAASVDTTAEEMKLELSSATGAVSAVGPGGRSDGRTVDTEPILGLEQRVMRLERAMTATLDLLQQMRRPPPARAADPIKG